MLNVYQDIVVDYHILDLQAADFPFPLGSSQEADSRRSGITSHTMISVFR